MTVIPEDSVDHAGRPLSPGLLSWLGYGAFLLTLGVLTYMPILDAWFVGDDVEEIWGAHIGGPQATQNLHAGRNFRPLNLWIHARIFDLAGFQPRAFHIVSILLNVIAAILVAAVARALMRRFEVTGRSQAHRMVPFLAGMMFVVMPNHTEAVSWISARGDVTMTCLLLLALLCWLPEIRTVPFQIGGLTAFALALISKESATVFPFVLSLLEAARRPGVPLRWRAISRALARPWAYYAVLLAYFVVRRVSLGTVSSSSLRQEFVGDSVTTLAVRGVALYVRTFVPGMAWYWWCVVVISALGLIAATGRSALSGRASSDGERVEWSGSARLISFLVLVPVVALAPVAHLGASPTNSGGERLVYFSSSFGCILLAWLLVAAVKKRRSVGAVAIILVMTGSIASLISTNIRWAEAGALAESVTEQMGGWPVNEPVFLLSTPDTLQGTYVLRNAEIATLLSKYEWVYPAPLVSLSSTEMSDRLESVKVTAGSVPNSWRLTLLAPESQFQQGDDPKSVSQMSGVEVRSLGSRSREFRFYENVSAEQIWFVSQGELHSVADL